MNNRQLTTRQNIRNEVPTPTEIIQSETALHSSVTSQVRRAKIQDSTPSGTSLQCKLLDSAGQEESATITVNLFGTATSSFPELAQDDIIPVFKDIDGSWYATIVMVDNGPC